MADSRRQRLHKSLAYLAAFAALAIVLSPYQNCAPSGEGGAFKLGGPGGSTTGGSTNPTPTPTPPGTVPDNAELIEFYVKSNNIVVVSTNSAALSGPLVNNGTPVYFSKVKLRNTGTAAWIPNDYRILVLDGATQWFQNGGTMLQCLDQDNGTNAPVVINPGAICEAYTVSPNPQFFRPTFAGIAAGTCQTNTYTTKTIRFRMFRISTGAPFGPTITKDILLCQN
jgi:hypothetical protein